MNRRVMLLGIFAVMAILPSKAEPRGKHRRGRRSGRSFRSATSSSSNNGDISFSSCKQAKASGYRRIREGEAGYSRRLDRDGDGIACE